ncbi:flagellar export protein FliJ [Anatilimnocola aggregata]|uniref:flagellar export protein FliJ n=1 Tax=Anatilimnocola aggregata TaxID=2528021 RepID=UPI00119FFF2B|nr:flagellar export protein FliJ [Anatilimnocola aggregata]
MQAFRFRLQTVLRLRIAARDERRTELGRALRAAEVLREQQAKLAAEAIENQEQTRQMMLRHTAAQQGVSVDGLLNAHRHSLVLKAQGIQLAQQQQQVAAEIAKRQSALVEADRDVRVLEKLQERRYTEHELASLALEQRELDEIALVRAFRQREGSK